MATRAAATAAKAIYAEPAFIPKGPINAGRFNLIREIAIGFTLGLTGGMMWKVRKCCNGGDDAVFDAAQACWARSRVGHRGCCCKCNPAAVGGLWDHLGLPLTTVCTNVVTTTALFVQMWHWGEKRRLAQYYSELYAREKAEEDAYTDELRSKLKALEEELLA
jgi:hypothetical protein